MLEHVEDAYAISPGDVLTVSDLNSHIAETIDVDPALRSVYLLGEVSNFSESSNSHLFFDLKDDDAKVTCVVFRHQRQQMEHEPENGDQILVKGDVDYYERQGDVSIKAKQMLPVGEGTYYVKLRKLMKKLEKERLFDEKHKQSVPDLPERIGVVTSKDGAAVQDIVNSIHAHLSKVDIYVKHAAVQGEHAVDDIVTGIRFFEEQSHVDTIVVGRGGGSIEDLQAFNDERVARTIFDAETPIISGVGHRTDETITGLVADVGAITPTEAGKQAVAEQAEFSRHLDELADRLRKAFETFQEMKEQEVKVEQATWRERRYQIAIAMLVLIILVLLAWMVL